MAFWPVIWMLADIAYPWDIFLVWGGQACTWHGPRSVSAWHSVPGSERQNWEGCELLCPLPILTTCSSQDPFREWREKTAHPVWSLTLIPIGDILT